LTVDCIQFATLAIVNQIKETRETIAKVEAPAAAMSNVKLSTQLIIQCGAIVKLIAMPINGMACRRVYASLFHRDFPSEFF
jgi:hypothetical protein